MLKYGPHPVLTIREIPQGRLFQNSSCSKVHRLVIGSRKWESSTNQDHHGLQVVVNDLFPLVALEEADRIHQHFGFEGLSLLPFVQFDSSHSLEASLLSYLEMSSPPPEGVADEVLDKPTDRLRLPSLPYLNGQEVLTKVSMVRRSGTSAAPSGKDRKALSRSVSESGSDALPPFQRPRSRGFSSPATARRFVEDNRPERGECREERGWSGEEGMVVSVKWGGRLKEGLWTLSLPHLSQACLRQLW